MIFFIKHEVVEIWRQGVAIVTQYHPVGGVAQIVWQSIRSCFGSGIWRSDKNWIRADKWKTK